MVGDVVSQSSRP